MLTDRKIIKYGDLHKIKGKVVLVTGCYDFLHLGHIIFFEYAKKQGDILVVGIGSDATIRKLKGEGRPLIRERLRARTVAAVEVVNYVVINKEPLRNGNIDHTILVEKLKPDVYVVPVTDSNLAGKRKLIKKWGKLVTCHRLPPNHLKGGISSSSLIQGVGE